MSRVAQLAIEWNWTQASILVHVLCGACKDLEKGFELHCVFVYSKCRQRTCKLENLQTTKLYHF